MQVITHDLLIYLNLINLDPKDLEYIFLFAPEEPYIKVEPVAREKLWFFLKCLSSGCPFLGEIFKKYFFGSDNIAIKISVTLNE